jgi:hypothetical protein
MFGARSVAPAAAREPSGPNTTPICSLPLLLLLLLLPPPPRSLLPGLAMPTTKTTTVALLTAAATAMTRKAKIATALVRLLGSSTLATTT